MPLTSQRFAAFHAEAPDPAAGTRALAGLPTLESSAQLAAVLEGVKGLGLWAPKLAMGESGPKAQPGDHRYQAAYGSVLIFPPHEWELLRGTFANWQFDGVEAAFENLPYSFDDIVPFAGLNLSPDLWLLILRGPLAGSVCWWTHDGDSCMDEPWAADIRAWGERIHADGPDVLGGTIRFEADDSPDGPPADAELYPLEYHPDGGAN
ncbi:MAG: hypothetical protein IPM64_07965 [Phycisphaerales bacterium]|nr:hypothetical protein [Phycisphaerales bacterium]